MALHLITKCWVDCLRPIFFFFFQCKSGEQQSLHLPPYSSIAFLHILYNNWQSILKKNIKFRRLSYDNSLICKYYPFSSNTEQTVSSNFLLLFFLPYPIQKNRNQNFTSQTISIESNFRAWLLSPISVKNFTIHLTRI